MSRNLIYALCATMIGCASVKPDPKEILSKFHYSQKLYVNTSFPHYYTVKSSSAGEADLEELVRTSELEEAWLHVPRMDLWVEIGMLEKSNGAVFSTEVFKFDEDMFYHIHPISAYKLQKEQAARFKMAYAELLQSSRKMQDGTDAYKRIVKFMENLRFNWRRYEASTILAPLPSPEDVFAIASYVKEARIASEFGISEIKYIGVTNKKARVINAVGLRAAYSKVFLELQDFGANMLLTEQVKPEEMVLRAFERVNDRFKGELEFTFRPWPEKR